MKNIILTFLAFCSLNVVGQISIDQNEMPVIGDTLRYSIAEITPIFLSTYQNTGPNYTWNFGNLNLEAQDVDEYLPSSQTFYSFPNTIARKYADSVNMGGFLLTNIFEFFSSNSNSFNTVGRGITYSGIPFSISYNNPDEVYQFPLDYLDFDSSTFQAQFINPFLQIYYSAEGYRVNEVDGYGQITTPFGTFNALRVVTDIVETDTISYGTNNFKLDTHIREYKWMAKGIKYPVLMVSGSVNAGNFVPVAVTYRDSVRNLTVGIGENDFAKGISISPNPVVSDEVKLDYKLNESTKLELQLYDISGKRIAKPKYVFAGSNESQLIMELPTSIANGMYFIKINSEKEQFIHKLIISR